MFFLHSTDSYSLISKKLIFLYYNFTKFSLYELKSDYLIIYYNIIIFFLKYKFY